MCEKGTSRNQTGWLLALALAGTAALAFVALKKLHTESKEDVSNLLKAAEDAVMQLEERLNSDLAIAS